MIEKHSLLSLIQFRHFILGSVKRELQLQSNGSLFGMLWVLLNPLSLTLVYALIFNNLMGAKLANHPEKFAYSIYLCAGLLPWNFFIAVLTRNVNVFVDHGNLLKKAIFPSLTLPIIVVLVETVNFLMALSVFLLFLVVVHRFPGVIILAMIPFLIIQQLLAVGIGIFLGCFHVFFRDVGKSIGIILQFWFWLTPIVYVSSILPKIAQKIIFTFNPMALMVSAYQQIILNAELPTFSIVCLPIILAVVFLVIALITHQRLSSEIVDEL